MKDPAGVTAMVLTFNEEIHIRACLESLRWCQDVVVVDSYSTDRTVAVARELGARVLEHEFTGFGDQRNWVLEQGELWTDWVLILDADERVTPELAEELAAIAASAPEGVGAYRVKRRFHMWGRWLRRSSLYPSWVVRFVHRRRMHYVNRGHSETQVVDGKVLDLHNDLIDENLKGIDEWFERQNRYARKEAEHELAIEAEPLRLRGLASRDPMARRAVMRRIAEWMPGRPLAYFLYSYVVRGGMLDGRDGFVFCMMRAVYQAMVVAKKHDLRRRAEKR